MDRTDDEATRRVQSIPVEVIEDTEQFRKLRFVESPKEHTAGVLARILVWSFVGTLLAGFMFGFYVLHRCSSMDEKTIAGSLEALKVVGSVFAPLLAFVLGYSFSKRED